MRIGVLVHGVDRTPQQMAAEIGTAADRGYAHAWVNQQPDSWDPLTVLAAAGERPIDVGTAIVPTYPHHPVALAEQALTAQAATGGRLTLGIGPSHPGIITGKLGIPYTRPAAHTREYLEILRPLLRGEAVSHHGEQLRADTKLVLSVTPPPVLLSAMGPVMLGLARDLADGTIAVWVRPDTVSDYLRPRLGDGRLLVSPIVAVTDDPDGFRDRVAEDFAGVGELPAYRAILERGGVTSAADTVIAGDEETVRRAIARYADAGVDDLIVSPHGPDQERTVAFAATL